MASHQLAFAAITLGAALVNGALGYGFSSITVPLALLFLSNRTLNPALVLIEIPLNASVLWANRTAIPEVWRRVLPIVIGLLPGIAAGTLIVSRASPGWLKLGTLAGMLPSVAIGVPAGALVIRRLQPETFRRLCMSFDAWVVSFGLSTLLRDLHLVDSAAAYLVMAVTVLIDGYLLVRFFSVPRNVVT